MLLIETIILFCLKQLNGERTIYSIYHLMNGKKSSQTLQDAHLYSLKRFFGILESLRREDFEKVINDMNDKQWIGRCGEQRFLPTELGESVMNENPLPHSINGWEFHQWTALFWERLSLFVQVASNFAFHEKHYLPIQKNREVHQWLKNIIKEIRIPREQIGRALYKELACCLEEAKDTDPLVIIYRLTGYQQIGLTAEQTAKKMKMGRLDYHLSFENILHYLISTVRNNERLYPLLSLALRGLGKSDFLTLSTRKTLELLNDGCAIPQIAAIRGLKVSTIEDHLVEIALNVPEFSIDRYVDAGAQKKIMEISRQASTRQLKQIKSRFTAASYLQIRLVLAKFGERS